MPSRPPDDITITAYARLAGRPDAESALDAIFFEASNTKVFATSDERAAFRERWLGRYLRLDPQAAFLACDAAGSVAGYLVGSLDDPATTPRFDDVGYFHLLADLICHYPAHLHVNLAPAYRSRGIGGALIAAFAAHAHARGAAGMHVVTSHGARNEGFYLRHGFAALRVFPWNGRDLVMLGRPLAP